MCNAYGLRAPVHKIAETFSDLRIPLRFKAGAAPNLAERDPVRPTETAPVVRADGADGAVLTELRWGLAPARPKAGPVINFRSEGRSFAAESRALILASWFYEFTGDRYPKTRWRFTKAGADGVEEDPFAIAGVLRAAGGVDAKGEPWPASFSLLTVEPGPDVAPIHTRQIVILERADWRAWLHGEAPEASALLRPSPAGTLSVRRDGGATTP